MKVINNWQRTGTALHNSTLSGGYKKQCKQMWTFLEVFICGKSVFSTVDISLIFSYDRSVLNCTLLCHSSLLIMSAKDKKSNVFSNNQM